MPSQILVQSEEQRRRYLSVDAPDERVRVGGNLKHDFDPDRVQVGDALKHLADARIGSAVGCSDVVAKKLSVAGIPFARRSTLSPSNTESVLLLNSIGELAGAFRYADIVHGRDAGSPRGDTTSL